MKTEEEVILDKHGYRVLAKTFKDRGFDFKQIYRDGKNRAIYFKSKPSGARGWETILIQKRESYQMAGVEIPKAEIFPRSEEWGHLGFTSDTEERAYKFLERLK